jgi:hypothetical protein
MKKERKEHKKETAKSAKLNSREQKKNNELRAKEILARQAPAR